MRSAPSSDGRITECAGVPVTRWTPQAIEALELTGRYAAAGNLSYYPPG